MLVIALFLFAFALYEPRTALSPQDSDGAEYAAASVTGSIVHPPGYPVYMTVARSIVFLFGSENPYYNLSLFSAFSQALAVGFLFLIICELGVGAFLSFLMALSWSIFPATIKTATDAEVFAFHHLLLGMILYCGALLKRHTGTSFWQTLLYGFLIGLGLAHHQTVILWAPLLLYFLFRGTIGSPAFERLFLSIVGAALGFSSYLSLLYCYNTAPVLAFTPPQNFNELYKYIARTAYGTVSLTAGFEGEAKSYLFHFLKLAGKTLPLALFGIVAALVSVFIRPLLASLMFCLTALLHGFFVYLLILPADTYLHGEWVSRFYPLVIFAGIVLFAWVYSEFKILDRLQPAFGALLVLPSLLSLPTALQYGDARHDNTTNYELKQLLSEIPKGAFFISSQDRASIGMTYVTTALHKRPDLTVVVRGMLGTKKYRTELAERDVLLKDLNEDRQIAFEEIVNRAHAANRPVFSNYGTKPPDGFKAVPLGVSWQWIKSEDLPPRSEVTKRILAFCAAWPDKLVSPSRTRRSSRHVLGRLFLWPIQNHIPLVDDPQVASRLTAASDLFIKGDLITAKEKCDEGYRIITDGQDPILLPYK